MVRSEGRMDGWMESRGLIGRKESGYGTVVTMRTESAGTICHDHDFGSGR